MTELQHPAPLGTLQDDLNVILAHLSTACQYCDAQCEDRILSTALIDIRSSLFRFQDALAKYDSFHLPVAISPSVNEGGRTDGN